MAEVWPVSLQQTLNSDFSYKKGDSLLRSSNDIGPDKVRRRSTVSVPTLSASIHLTTAQYSVLDYFYETSLNGGAKTFSFVHPISGLTKEFRFSSPPAFRYLGAGKWICSMEWEEMP